MTILIRTLRILMTAASLIALAISPAFSPAIFIALLLMTLSGVIAFFGQLKTAVANLGITSLALAVGPLGIDHIHSLHGLLLFLTPMLVGFLGLMIGVNRLQREKSPRQ